MVSQELNEALEFEIKNRLKTDQIKDVEEQMIQEFFKKVNTLIQVLHSLGVMHAQVVDHFKSNTIKVKLPDILSEIFEIENGPINVNMEKSFVIHSVKKKRLIKKKATKSDLV